MLNGLNPLIAFLAGLASFVSPCVLPLVPAYLAYLGGRRAGADSIAVAGAAFVAGLSLIFILFFYVFSLGATPQGLSLMIAYCLGLGLPFLALAFGLENARPLVAYVNAHRRAIDLASAAVLVVMGVLLLTNRLTWLSAGLVQLIPSWPSPSL